jgi:hypothetical protein
MARFQLLSGPERRRRWSEEQKRALVAAAFALGAIVSEVARRGLCCTDGARKRGDANFAWVYAIRT